MSATNNAEMSSVTTLRRSRPPRTGAGHGFSLVELPVVVAITAVLAALLLPALARSQSRAKQIQCSSNLRQLAIAARMDHGDHGGRGIFYRGVDTLWMETLIQYYAKVEAVRLCPSAMEPSGKPNGATAGDARTAWTWGSGPAR